MRKVGDQRYQVSGTPTDCVLMAVCEFMVGHPPTAVLSGINSEANLAEDVSYSGTCAAAMEGTLLGVRSIALSQVGAPNGTVRFDPAERYAPALVRTLMEATDWPEGSFVNVNFPNSAPEKVAGIRLTVQGRRPPGSFSIDARADARSQPYFWVKLAYPAGNEYPETDLHAIAENAVSVTPIRMDFTDHDWRGRLEILLNGRSLTDPRE